MFSKNKNETSSKSHKNQEKPRIPSILSEDLHINGDLKTEGDIQLDGVIDGDIRTHSLTVGASAIVNGSIVAETINVSGTVNGTITGTVVVLASTAKIVGDIIHQSLAIEAGARIEGMCRHVDPDRAAELAGPTRPSLVVTEGSEEAEAS